MDKTEYITKCEALLQDNSIYQNLYTNTSPTIQRELIKILQDTRITISSLNRIHPTKTSWLLFPSSKVLWSMHPIVSACGKATYNTAKFITKILQNYCGNTSYFVKDSTDFIKNIKHLSINPEETLVSFDVSTLFTNIPVPVALQVINSKISTCTNFTIISTIPKEKFIKLLEFTITNCVFCFSKKFYKTLQHAAIGSSVSPVIANIYMEYFESLPFPSSSSPALIKWWFRYLHDVHSATRKDQVNKLQKHLNSIDPHIKFTTALPGTDGLPFLDTLTKPTSNSIESTVYRKPTHTDRYLNYNSNHPISAKLSVIHTLTQRAKEKCSTPEFLAKEMDHLHIVLQDNHYPTQFFQQGKPQQKPNKKQKPIHSKVHRRS